jgi:hypothetical protein
MRLTERHRPCRFPAYPTRFRRSREEGDFAKGRGRTNTEAGNRGHQDQRHRGSSRRIARHRFGKAFQVSAGTSAIRQPRRVRVWSLHNSRPRSRRAADKRDEIAALHLRTHSITSSARASSMAGTSRPRAFAVLRLTARTILVGNSSGRSPGAMPRRILSTKNAQR